MANLVPGNMENIFWLLSQHNFTIINNDSDDFKCIICRKILSNACQAICGCNYCQNCVDERVIGGEVFCPGITEECRTANLSNVLTNHRLNRQISQLIVKCSEETCNYESQLRTMGEHLRLCPKRSVECPFNDVGCDRENLTMDKLEEHLQHESLRHSEILIEVIGNLRNEVAELKRNEEKDRLDIDRLERCDTEKGAIIESMRVEIQSIKLENAALERRMENILEGKCDKTSMEIDAQCMREKIELIEGQLGEMRREWSGERERLAVIDAEEREKEKEYRREMTDRIDAVEREKEKEYQREITDRIDSVERDKEKEYWREMTDRIDAVEKCLAENISDADCVITIDNIAEARKSGFRLYSEYFKGCAEPYKIRLRYCFDMNELFIRLRLYVGDSDGSLRWPFKKHVTIAVVNQMSPKSRKSITKFCTIAKPSKDLYKYSDLFAFKWNELSDGGLLQNDRLTVRCLIHW